MDERFMDDVRTFYIYIKYYVIIRKRSSLPFWEIFETTQTKQCRAVREAIQINSMARTKHSSNAGSQFRHRILPFASEKTPSLDLQTSLNPDDYYNSLQLKLTKLQRRMNEIEHTQREIVEKQREIDRELKRSCDGAPLYRPLTKKRLAEQVLVDLTNFESQSSESSPPPILYYTRPESSGSPPLYRCIEERDQPQFADSEKDHLGEFPYSTQLDASSISLNEESERSDCGGVEEEEEDEPKSSFVEENMVEDEKKGEEEESPLIFRFKAPSRSGNLIVYSQEL